MTTVVIVVAGIVVMVLVIGLWWLSWAPERRSWCVLFYLVGREPRSTTLINSVEPLTGVPNGKHLDQKLDQVIQTLKALPCSSLLSLLGDLGWTDVHVAYRALWDDIEKPPFAEVVNWGVGTVPSTSYFPGESAGLPFAVDLTNDLQLFFDWAYTNCPADHYAVFFWGHSMGPAGLFEIAEPPVVVAPPQTPPGTTPPPPAPPPGVPGPYALLPHIDLTFSSLDLEHFEQALDSLVQRRLAEPPMNAASARVEVVLFQDCWMSTLETAYELQDTVRYIVASQSLVPIGYYHNNLGAVWPYRDLINTLLREQDFSGQAFKVLGKFFRNEDLPSLPPSANADFNSWPNVSVPFTLLDLGPNPGDVSATLTGPLQHFVSALQPLGLNGRHLLIPLAAKFDVSGGTLHAGDVALVDVLTLCGNLLHPGLPTALGANLTVAQINNINAAAQAVKDALGALTLIKDAFEWSPDPARKLGFTGVSMLFTAGLRNYLPDPYIVDTITFGGYAKFRFAIDTNLLITIPPQQPTPTQAQPSWTKYAIE